METKRPLPTFLQRCGQFRRRTAACRAAVQELTAANPPAELPCGGAAKAAPSLLNRRGGGKAASLELGVIRLPSANHGADAGDALGDYSFLEVLGRGTFGTVYRARHATTGQLVALKTFHAPDGDWAAGSAKSEHRVMGELSHRYIVRALDFFVHGSREVSVMELFAGASISQALRRGASKTFAEGDSRTLFRALVEALGYMHCKGYVHRDVKPENVLVSEDLRDLRLVDFNLACLSSDLTSLSCAGSEFYAAPEVVAGAPPTEKNDVWGAGVCLHVMLSGRAPNLCGAPAGSAQGLQELPLTGKKWAKVSEGARSAARWCLALRRELRPPASSILEHPWLANAEEHQGVCSHPQLRAQSVEELHASTREPPYRCAAMMC